MLESNIALNASAPTPSLSAPALPMMEDAKCHAQETLPRRVVVRTVLMCFSTGLQREHPPRQVHQPALLPLLRRLPLNRPLQPMES